MNRILLVCMVISLLSGLTLMFVASSDESRFIDPDSNDYINLADSLVAGKGYSQDGEPEIFRAPGYPLLIAPLRWAFPGTVLPIVVLQIIINASTLLILWHLAGKVFSPSPKIAKFATVLQAERKAP